MTKLIILRGYPGSGKTTIGKILQKKGFGVFIDHNRILTFIADIANNDIGIYDEIHRLEQAITKKLLGEGQSVVVARGFSSAKSMEPYRNMANKLASEYFVFRLEVPFEILAKRVTAPERKVEHNPTVSADSLNDWVASNHMQAIEKETLINASQPIEQVVGDIVLGIKPLSIL